MYTTLGVVDVLLFDKEAPLSVRNFLGYVSAKRYDGTVIHRAPKNFVVQGGGYSLLNGSLSAIAKSRAINLEYSNSRPNARGTIAMARTNDLNSATSEWFINTVDNTRALDASNNGGYAVFGRVTEPGMAVVLAIAALPLTSLGGTFNELPVLLTRSGPVQAADLVYLTSVVQLPKPLTNADRALNYLEAAYSSFLKPPGSVSATGAAGGVTYYFRYYAASNAYIGVSVPGNEVFYLVPQVGPNVTRFSTLADMMPTVTAAGY